MGAETAPSSGDQRLCFLHGVRKDNKPMHEGWFLALEKSFGRLDEPFEFTIDETRTLQYGHVQTPQGRYVELTPLKASSLEMEAAKDRYQHRREALAAELRPLRARKLGHVEPGDIWWRARKAGVVASRRSPHFQLAERIRKDKQFREAVVAEVLDDLPKEPHVLVAHSLGSIVAVELLPYLPMPSPLTMLVTIGSPLSNRALYQRALTPLKKDFPYVKVGSWVNIRGRWDLVTGGKALSRRLPQVVDVPINTGAGWSDAVQRKSHRRRRYLRDKVTATAIRRGLAWVDEERTQWV